MRIVEQNNFHVVDKAVDAIDEVRQKSMSGDVDEEPFYICNISDIIQKHRIWQQRMPRVLPFYGKLIQTRNYFSPFTNISNSLNLTWKYAAKKNIFNVYLNHYSVQTGFSPPSNRLNLLGLWLKSTCNSMIHSQLIYQFF